MMLMRLLERLYRYGLHLCPRSFREDYGDEVAKDFARLVREAGHDGMAASAATRPLRPGSVPRVCSWWARWRSRSYFS